MRNSLLFFTFVHMASCLAQVTLHGGKGQLRVWDAEPVPAGHLYLSPFYSFYAEKADAHVIGDKTAIIGTKRELLEDHSVHLNFTIGLSHVFELLLHAVPYQDNQRDLWGPIGDTQIGVKVHIPKKTGLMQYGLLGLVRIPTAPRHNIPYESFSMDAYGWGLTGLVNFDLKNSTLQVPLKFCLNVGYRDHNWHDQFFRSRYDQLFCGLALKFPIRTFLFYSELTSEIFINNSEYISFSQNFHRFSQGFRFVGFNDFIFDIACDIRLGAPPPTAYEYKENPYLKAYADWKIILGASYRIHLFTYRTEEEKARLQQSKQEQKKLDEIRQQREKVLKDLEELRKQVEKEKEEKPPF
ncbi:hypothetical protein JXO59_06775 [candidate division KSB1 bacterium]|nr:hypothetical protein [candidate division KSB1 bacterium]